MLLPPGMTPAEVDARIDRFKDNLDVLLDATALLIFNIGYKLGSERVCDLAIYVPTADRLIG